MQLPVAFENLHAAGRLDYWGGARYHDLSKEERAQRLAERYHRVLWLRGIEWDVAPAEVGERDELPAGAFEFAGNGAGDSYVFYPPLQGGALEPPVFLIPHDDDRAAWFAPSFVHALVRLWLQQGAEWSDEHDGPGRVEALRAWAAIIAPHLGDDERPGFEALAEDPAPGRLAEALRAFVHGLPAETIPARR